MQKKILIITYYWPPCGGSGVQRWLKFVKYLPQFGWTPYVCTPENPAFNLRDESLLKDVPEEAEVLRLPIWEPYRLLGKLTSQKEESPVVFPKTRKSWASLVSTFIRGNFFIPDPRIFWVKPASRFLEDLIQQEKISHMVTTGPPHSVHLIGLRLKKRIPSVKWIADFRDPWSEWHLLDDFLTTRPVKEIHRYLERKIITRADAVLTVTPYLAQRFSMRGGRKITCITNGYDDEDFIGIDYHRTDHFTIRHVGLLRDAGPFMNAFKNAVAANEDFGRLARIEFIGVVHDDFRKRVQEDKTLRHRVNFMPYIPHEQLKTVYSKTDLLLLVIPDVPLARGYLPGKLFEYLACCRPVIGLGPEDGDAAEVLKNTGSGSMAGWKNVTGLTNLLLGYFRQWQNGDNLITTNAARYSRKNLTADLVNMLNTLG